MLGSLFRSEDVTNCQKTWLGLASLISFSLACTDCQQLSPLRAQPGSQPAASNTIEVEVLVHSSKMIRCGTLEASPEWLDSARCRPLRQGVGSGGGGVGGAYGDSAMFDDNGLSSGAAA